MSTTRQDLNLYLRNYLHVDDIKDYAPNGLQVEGREKIGRIVTGVTACLALIEKAISLKADAILVHHGYFWKGESPVITGAKARRIGLLMSTDTNLFGYHLPLDMHSELGNNVLFAKELGIELSGEVWTESAPGLVLKGTLPDPMDASDFAAHIETKLKRTPQHIAVPNRPIRNVAWCTGAAQDFIEDAAHAGVDAFLSGEISERTTHMARELGIHYFACGHHASERYGIQALGEHLAKEFNLEHQFVDVDNPV